MGKTTVESTGTTIELKVQDEYGILMAGIALQINLGKRLKEDGPAEVLDVKCKTKNT